MPKHSRQWQVHSSIVPYSLKVETAPIAYFWYMVLQIHIIKLNLAVLIHSIWMDDTWKRCGGERDNNTTLLYGPLLCWLFSPGAEQTPLTRLFKWQILCCISRKLFGFCFLIFVFWNRVLLCSSSWPRTCYVDRSGFKLRDLLASAFAPW